jgi:hypothetical protein
MPDDFCGFDIFRNNDAVGLEETANEQIFISN